MKTLIKAQLYNYLHSQLSIMSQWKLRDCINHCNLPEQIPLPNISQKWRLRVELKPLNLPVKLHSLGGAMKNFTCDILRNNVEPGWYRANAGPIQAGQCWADTIGPMLGRYRQVHRLLSRCVQCTGSVPFIPLPVQTVLASTTPALAQYLYVCWVVGTARHAPCCTRTRHGGPGMLVAYVGPNYQESGYTA